MYIDVYVHTYTYISMLIKVRGLDKFKETAILTHKGMGSRNVEKDGKTES